MTIYIDHTHLGRHVTGLERITQELFSAQALQPLEVTPVTSRGTAQMITTQTFGLPARLATSEAVLLCPGFPPSPFLLPFAKRVLPYIHDDFLVTRIVDLNMRARLYMATPFRIALKHYPRFLTNSRDTQRKIAKYIRSDAEITLYRPPVRNVFNLTSSGRSERNAGVPALRVVALGTVEPRKNLVAAGHIVGALRRHGFPGATLDIIGRNGWGDDWRLLAQMPCVSLHGYQSSDTVARLLEQADLFLCTSHDEGLGLPLLEAQYAGLPVAAPHAPVFHEVLGDSGIFIDTADHAGAAAQIGAALATPDWRSQYVEAANRNLMRWNALAVSDHEVVVDLIARLAAPRSATHRGTSKDDTVAR